MWLTDFDITYGQGDLTVIIVAPEHTVYAPPSATAEELVRAGTVEINEIWGENVPPEAGTKDIQNYILALWAREHKLEDPSWYYEG